jgi:predicted ribosomally synthesized peptide with SipW-like signal peptide
MKIRLAAPVVGLVVLGLAMSAPGTLAVFTDSSTSSGTVMTAVLDMQVSDEDENFVDDLATVTWDLGSDVIPGEPVGTVINPGLCKSVQMRNVGTRDGSSISVSVVNGGSGSPGIATEIIATRMTFDGFSILGDIDGNADGVPGRSMRDLELQGGVSGLAGLSAGVGTRSFSMCLQFSPDAGNEYQGQSWLGTVGFTLHQ